jgi:hypothetical protein
LVIELAIWFVSAALLPPWAPTQTSIQGRSEVEPIALAHVSSAMKYSWTLGT